MSKGGNGSENRSKTFVDRLEWVVRRYYLSLYGGRPVYSRADRAEDGLALVILIASLTVSFTVLNWFLIDLFQFLQLEVLITILGMGSVVLVWLPVSIGVYIVFVRPTHWGWLFVAAWIIAGTFSWNFWGVWMIALWINSDQWLLELLQYTPLFR